MKLSSDYLKGYEGTCRRCHRDERAYYYFADTQHRRQMRDGVFMAIDANCPACVTSPIFSSPHTMEWKRQLNPKEVEADLKVLAQGVQIDFDYAEDQAKESKKMDIVIENNDKRSQELIDFYKKKV